MLKVWAREPGDVILTFTAGETEATFIPERLADAGERDVKLPMEAAVKLFGRDFSAVREARAMRVRVVEDRVSRIEAELLKARAYLRELKEGL